MNQDNPEKQPEMNDSNGRRPPPQGGGRVGLPGEWTLPEEVNRRRWPT